MLNIFVRTIVLYVMLLIVMRLMGKRQLGELQPFEFSITLVVAELTVIPMSDPSIPLVYGIIPMFTMFIIHILITYLSIKNQRFRKVLNGKPLIVISEGSVDTVETDKANLTANDLMEALRGAGYFSIGEVQYAILETNGNLSVMPKFANKPATCADLGVTGGSAELAHSIIVEGKFLGENLSLLGADTDKEEILNKLKEFNLTQKDVFILSLNQDKTMFVQPYGGTAINTAL